MTPMPIPMEPMDSIALDVFQHPSYSHRGEVYDRMLLCVCLNPVMKTRMSG